MRSTLLTIGLFVLSLVLAAGAGALVALGILTPVAFVPLVSSFALAVVLVALGVGVAAVVNSGNDEKRRILCNCGYAYLRTAVVAALVALVAALVFGGLVVVPIITGIIFGLIVLFLLFAIFLLAAFIFCLLDGACDPCPCGSRDS